MGIRVGIVGAGNIATSRHIPAYKNHNLAEVVNIYDRKPERATKVAQKHNLTAETNFQTLFDEVDLVSICTPPWVHATQTISALEHGCHVLTEKPMAMSSAEATQMMETAQSRDLILSVVHNFLYMQSIQRVREAVQSESLGPVNRTFAIQLKRFTHGDRHSQEWFDNLPGGLFWDESPHMLYLTEAFLGEMNLDSASVSPREGAKQQYKTVRARFAGATGGEGNVLMAFDSPVTEWWFIVVCEQTVFFVDVFRDLVMRFNEETDHSALRVLHVLTSGVSQLAVGGVVSGLRLLRDRFVDGYRIPDSGFSVQVGGVLSAIERDDEPPVTARDGAAILSNMVEITRATDMRAPKDDR